MNFGIIGYNIGIQLANMRRNIIPKPVCLTFSSPEQFTIATGNAKKNWDGTLYYSTNASAWNEWDGTTAIASAEHGGVQKIYIRGSGNSKITGGSGKHWVLRGNGIYCDGNIECLLDYETAEAGGHPAMAANCFYYLFRYCASLKQAPEFPAVTLAQSCYEGMFAECTGLERAPDLPATATQFYCYREMFKGCAALTTAPALPATTLVRGCYDSMFYGCTSLNTIPALPAANITGYQNMFYGCSKIKLSTTKTGEYQTAYRLPTSGTGSLVESSLFSGPMDDMFTNTGGTFKGTPNVNTTYYTSNTVV